MVRSSIHSGKRFGGSWTKEKLDILQRYLNAYTTALKNQPFRLWYIDAFAGTGDVQLRASEDGTEEFLCWQRSESEPPTVWKVSHLGRVRVYASFLSSVPLSQ